VGSANSTVAGFEKLAVALGWHVMSPQVGGVVGAALCKERAASTAQLKSIRCYRCMLP
jgi:hypothetical protein